MEWLYSFKEAFWWLLGLGAVALLLTLVVVVVYILLTAEMATGGLLEEEKCFAVPAKDGTRTRAPFPVAFSESKPAVYMTFIAPAYNEEERLPIMMDKTLEYVKNRSRREPSFTWEIIIVDDGSRDNTTEIGLGYVAREGADKVRVLTLAKNRGKGGAVKRGMMVARGAYCLMVDADGATEIQDVEKLEMAMDKLLSSSPKTSAHNNNNGGGGADKPSSSDMRSNQLSGADIPRVAVGSRAHLEQDAVARRTILRNILMWGFHFLVAVVGGVRGIRDTQCGFKLFSRSAAKQLFSNLHIERWCFDIELLFLCSVFGIPVEEMAVNWQEIPGSKLGVISASLQMAKDLFRIRICYMFGVWKAQKPKTD